MSSDERIVTIKEVAKKAGVAISTVSRVLNGLDRVSEGTKIKVNHAVAELGYVKNSIAASMKSGSTNLIVVIVPDIINEFYTSVIQGVEETAIKNGFYTLVFSTYDSHVKESELFSGNFGKIIDGAIIIPSHDNLQYYEKLHKPVVAIDRYVDNSSLQAVVIDNFKGAYLLTKELAEAGHRDIAILLGSLEFNIGSDRLAGYLKVLEEYDIPKKEENIMIDTWYRESGYSLTKELLKRTSPPTAIVATNNLLCVGCYQAITDANLRIGKDFSLVGFDDNLVASLMKPGITVVKRATTEMGRVGAQKLISLLRRETQDKQQRKVVMGVELVRRGSVAVLNKSKLTPLLKQKQKAIGG